MGNNTIKRSFVRHAVVLKKTAQRILPEAERAAEILLNAAKNGHRLFICGNGGSAADSQHFAAEWVCKYKNNRPPLPATALAADTSVLTAVGNDYGFENVFSRQIQALGKDGDVLVAITTSGKSRNVLRAVEKARRKGMKVIVLTGTNGEDMRKSADAAIVVPSNETARVQEIHELIYHAWCEYVDSML